jgi:hypothetical protein
MHLEHTLISVNHGFQVSAVLNLCMHRESQWSPHQEIHITGDRDVLTSCFSHMVLSHRWQHFSEATPGAYVGILYMVNLVYLELDMWELPYSQSHVWSDTSS